MNLRSIMVVSVLCSLASGAQRLATKEVVRNLAARRPIIGSALALPGHCAAPVFRISSISFSGDHGSFTNDAESASDLYAAARSQCRGTSSDVGTGRLRDWGPPTG